MNLCLVYMHMCRPVEMLLDSVLLCPINYSVVIPAGVHYIHVDICALVAFAPYPDNRTVRMVQSAGMELIVAKWIYLMSALHMSP